MALRDFWRGGQRDHPRDDIERTRFPLDPLSRDSWHDEAQARYGDRPYRDYQPGYQMDDDNRRFNDRWQNSYDGPAYGRFDERDPGRRAEEYGGSSSNPFYGDHPLTRAGSTYDSSYFGGNGLPTNQWRPEPRGYETSELVYGAGAEREMEQWRSGPLQGRSQQGQFRGFGPRGYRRSDERIKDDVCQCLTDDEHIDASDIEVTVNDREVMLSGTVQSRAEKRHAEDLIERLPGVRDVINGLKIVSGVQGTASSQQSTDVDPHRQRGGWR